MSGMVLVDYQKAFDIADHERLLKNLEAYGIVKNSVRVVCSCPVQNKWLILAERNRVSHWLNMESLRVVFWVPYFLLMYLLTCLFTLPFYVDLYADDTTITAYSDFRNIP